MSKKIGAVITTLNEEATVGKLIRDLRSQGFLVCVIDDNSTDKTRDELHYNGAQIQIFNSVRVGIGPCLMDGWKCLLENNCDYIVQIDAGGSHDPLDAALLLAMLETCEADIVIGSRFTWSSKYIGDRKRQMLSRLAAAACNLVTGAKFHDWTSGYRVFNAKAIRYLLTKDYIATMHGWQIETLAYANEHGLDILEAPITYKAGRSSFNWKVAWEAFVVWTHLLHHVGWHGSRLDEV